MQIITSGEVINNFIDDKSNLGIISVDAGDLFSAKVKVTNHSLVFVRKYERIQIKVNHLSSGYSLGPKSVFCVPALSTFYVNPCGTNCSFTILSPSTDHYRNIERNCKLTKKQFDNIFSEPLTISRKRWMDELIHRYVFERVVAKNSKNYVTKFLELEIMKEIYFNYKEEKDDLRKQQFAMSSMDYKDTDIITKTVAYIESNLFNMPMIKNIINVVGTSESTLYRSFKSSFNKSPQQYIKDRLLQESRILLLSGEYNVSDVAYMVGYNNVSSFSYAFKKKFLKAPHELLEDESYEY